MTIEMIGVDFIFLQPEMICHGDGKNEGFKSRCEKMRADDDYSHVYEWLESHLKDLEFEYEVLWKIVVMHFPFFRCRLQD